MVVSAGVLDAPESIADSDLSTGSEGQFDIKNTAATGEAQAHLNYLEKRGRAERTRDENGVDWWTAVKWDEETT